MSTRRKEEIFFGLFKYIVVTYTYDNIISDIIYKLYL